ncbi:hypothetical protein [Brevundimonas sp.]|uniref:hypothetical protein n=1 Tax=Brevundimonas sp. TaxID=1871086 RepID=UPI003BAD2210
MARLKVFTWSDGFHAFSVATSSRPKALQAWGIGSDIFQTGLASEITAGPDYDAALASPGEVIERGLAIDVGKVAKAPRPKAKAADDRARKALKALEAELETLDSEQAEQTTEIDDRRAALEAEARALAARQAQARQALMARIKSARAKL